MGVRLAAGVGVLIIIVVGVAVLTQSTPESLGSNSTVRASGVALEVPAGLRLCQRDRVPPRAARIRVFSSVERRGGPLRVSIQREDADVSTGTSGPIAGEQTLIIPLVPPVTREVPGARICFTNGGTTTVRLAGNRTPARVAANPTRTRLNDDPRIDFFAAERSSRLGLAGSVAERLPMLKAGFLGGWTIWALAALVCVVWLFAFSLIRSLDT